MIVGGADIACYENIVAYLRDDDFFVFCDCGLKHMNSLKVKADLVVGDFDSFKGERPDAETIVLPREKDDTDTVFAVKEALKRGFEDFLLIGAVGARLDHTLGNVSILAMLDSMGKKAMIADDYSEMEVVSGRKVFIDDSYAYFSLLNIFGTAKGININNAKYPLENAEITCEYQYGISNEVLKGQSAEVRIDEGRMLLVRIRNR